MTDPIVEALAACDQPQTALAALGRLAEQVTGARLVTLMTADPETGEAERIWSNMPGPYPVSGRKPIQQDAWSRHVLELQKTFVANDISGIVAVFADHPLILSLGCESVMNLPVVVAGQVLGTINCLDGPGYWTPERLAGAEVLRLPAAAAYLLHRLLTKGR